MKAMKKLASLLLALALVFSLGLTAFADDEDLDGGMTVDTATISVEDNRTSRDKSSSPLNFLPRYRRDLQIPTVELSMR